MLMLLIQVFYIKKLKQQIDAKNAVKQNQPANGNANGKKSRAKSKASVNNKMDTEDLSVDRKVSDDVMQLEEFAYCMGHENM